MMRQVAAERANSERPFKFVVNVGDNFYPAGVSGTDDPVWDSEWGDIYTGLPAMPWYSVYGNHDYGQFNRPCLCEPDDVPGSLCAQVQKHGAVKSDQTWFMPAMNFHATPLPGVNLEVIGLDTNIVDYHKLCPWVACEREKCEDHEAVWPGCNKAFCKSKLHSRSQAAYELLSSRIAAAETSHRQLIVFSHYPSNWLRPAPHDFTKLLQNPKVGIAYFGGHVHMTDNTTNVAHYMRRQGWNDYCVGGGGGWACDGHQGFVTGEVRSDGTLTGFQFHMATDHECCYRNPRHSG